MVACQDPLSMGLFSLEYWSVLSFPSPGDLPDPGIEPGSSALQTEALPSEPQGSPQEYWRGLHALLQGILLTQGSSWCLLCLLHGQACSLTLNARNPLYILELLSSKYALILSLHIIPPNPWFLFFPPAYSFSADTLPLHFELPCSFPLWKTITLVCKHKAGIASHPRLHPIFHSAPPSITKLCKG